MNYKCNKASKRLSSVPNMFTDPMLNIRPSKKLAVDLPKISRNELLSELPIIPANFKVS